MSPRSLATTALASLGATLVALVPSAAHAGPADAPTAPTTYLSTPFDTLVSGNLCTGATDPQGNPISVSSVNPGAGTVDLQGCAFTYTPPVGASGDNHGFSYRLTDGTNISTDLIVQVAVGVAGNAPVVTAGDALDAKKNRWLLIEDIDGTLLANDVDPEGAPMTVGSHSIGTFLPGEQMIGAASFGPKAVQYRPPTDFVGTRTFVYEAQDGVNETHQSFTITVADAGAFQKPVTVADSYDVPRNGSLKVARAQGILANDTDADSSYVRANAWFTSTTHGTITGYNAYTGEFTYTPAAGFVGTDTFQYYAVDPEGNHGDAVTVTLHVVTPPPVAVVDSYKTAQGVPLVTDAAHGLLANDSDPDSSFEIGGYLAPGLHGTFAPNLTTGAFTWTPSAGWSGTDLLTYRLVDPDGNTSDWVTVTLKAVAPGGNEAPDALPNDYQVREGNPLTVAAPGLLGNDADFEAGDLDVASHTEPAHGDLTAFDAETGAFTYTGDAGWRGTDSFTYRASDAQGTLSAPAAVTIKVFNDKPVVVDDSYTTVPGVPFVVPAAEGVLANDTDLEGDSFEKASHFSPQHGKVFVELDGSFTYTPADGFTGVDTFKYDVRDAAWNLSDTATVTITVAPGTITSPAPTVSGTARVGSVLTAGTATWGPGTVTKAYQWLRSGAVIEGATQATYRLGSADLGTMVSVRVTGTKAGYPSVERTSTARTVAHGILVAPRPRISGTPAVGRTLKAIAGTWGPGTVVKTYRWYRNGVAIKGASRASYRLTRADRGRRITVRVTGRKAGYVTTVRTSGAVRVR
ncbi:MULTISPECIES: Ig-like domain-containing protein [unclassified Nocardioides]|uniref:Ig-like domain-containing protein n=1 Tax=unclassified Nocardioides TaxID=2615069 RepID=UPI000703600B|nr:MULTISPECIES: Ig-like domain-containing protein [unclassified Nocardioides]KRC53546.1 hypothetical protein ASE19_14540 [Nocardioides sp. Root79]KRC67978.1 hypothetical protein ASE20_18215 [Nocardioides sp. Root240]